MTRCSVFFISHLLLAASTLFPYTTLFRSARRARGRHGRQSGRPGRSEGRQWRVEGSHRERQLDGQQPDRPDCLRSEEHTSELQSHSDLVCRLLLEKKKK